MPKQVIKPKLNLLSFRSRAFWGALISISALALAAASQKTTEDPTQAWLGAPQTQGAHWDREAQLKPLIQGKHLEGMSRSGVLGLIGQPGFSSEDFPGDTRLDLYRISAANKQSLRIDYDKGSKVVSDEIDQGPCDCSQCRQEMPSVSRAALAKSGLLEIKQDFVSSTPTIGQIENMLGKGKLNQVQSTAGGQVWMNFSETWRVEGATQQFFLADGHDPLTKVFGQPIQERQFLSWSLISYAPDCLAR